MNAAPLRLSTERVVMYGALLTMICLVQIRFVVAQGFGDWSSFWAAGSTAGTPLLLDPHSHAVWQTAHHVPATIFPYQPGAAWFWYPFKFISLPAGYAVNVILMAAAAIASAAIAARIYQIPASFAVPLALAWAPVTAALATGQNSPAGLLLSLCAILALVADSQVMCGVAVGALLYKLPYALPVIVVLLVRGKMTALAIVAACAAGWYVLGAAASGGDWHWPSQYSAALQGYFAADAHHNATKAISIPSLLLRAGVPQTPALLAGAALFALSIPLLVRVPLLEAASFALLVALAAGPHVLPYDLALALPALFYFMTHAAEPGRTRLVCLLYLIAPFWLLSDVLHFDVLALACDIAALAWIVKGYYESTTGTHLDFAHSRNRGQA